MVASMQSKGKFMHALMRGCKSIQSRVEYRGSFLSFRANIKYLNQNTKEIAVVWA